MDLDNGFGRLQNDLAVFAYVIYFIYCVFMTQLDLQDTVFIGIVKLVSLVVRSIR